jgi:hypothetical protein
MQAAQSRAMRRKPILMPDGLITKVDKIARERKVSFGEVVRNAVDAFDTDLSNEDTTVLEALADEVIQSSAEVIAKIDATIAYLDETHAILEASKPS